MSRSIRSSMIRSSVFVASIASISGLASGCGSDASGGDPDPDTCSATSLSVPDEAPASGVLGEPYATKWSTSVSAYEVATPPPGLDAQLQGTPTSAGTFDVSVRFSNACDSRDVSYTMLVEDIPPQCDDDEDCAILAAPFVGETGCKKDGDCSDDYRCIKVTSTLTVCAQAEASGSLVCGQCLRSVDVAPAGSTVESLDFCVFDESQELCAAKPDTCSSARHCIAP